MADYPPAINGTEQRLDALLAEFRAFRDEQRPVALEPVAADGAVELKEPGRPAKARQRRKG